MRFGKCESGHIYDMELYDYCPYCGVSDDKETMPLAENTKGTEDYPSDDEKTRGIPLTSTGNKPVVGWLVCISGPHEGQSFNLYSGGNFIGRDSKMAVCISKDLSVSRQKHLNISFEPKSCAFWVTMGDTEKLSYLNGDVILERKMLSAYDRISLGETELMFIPFCSDKFAWECDK